jgi:oxygen-independent coproporphyrinogen-3 oxidase
VYAFGVTAISQLTSAYAQNIKDIPSYIAQINQEGLATTKGYVLNKDEQITREVITSLMCNCNINWNSLAEHLNLSVEELKQATAYNESALQSFADDGIIEWNEQQIAMHADALHWVRNVAASLDKLMLNNNKSYSKPI